jgi:hypothetical protein
VRVKDRVAVPRHPQSEDKASKKHNRGRGGGLPGNLTNKIHDQGEVCGAQHAKKDQHDEVSLMQEGGLYDLYGVYVGPSKPLRHKKTT